MIGNKGGFFDFVIVVATILVGSFLWLMLDSSLVDIQESLEDAVPDEYLNESVNATLIHEDFNKGESIFYYSWMLFVIALILYAIKKTQEDKRLGAYQ